MEALVAGLEDLPCTRPRAIRRTAVQQAMHGLESNSSVPSSVQARRELSNNAAMRTLLQPSRAQTLDALRICSFVCC